MATMPDFEMPDERPSVVRRPALPSVSQPSADGPGSEGPDARLRARWRRVRVPLLAGVVGAAVALGGVVAVEAVRDVDARADVTVVVDAYVDAVESADTATIADSPLDGAVATTALLLAGVTPVATATVRCDEPRIGDGIATVVCEVRVERRTAEAQLLLEQVDGAWQVVRGLEVPVRLRSGALIVQTVDGTPLEPTLARGQEAAWMLPGRYDVTVRTPQQLEVEQLEGLVVSGSTGSVRWTSDTSEQLDADVQASALAFVEECAALPREGCPALQERDPAEPFGVFDVVGELRPDDPYAMTFGVSIRRPVEDPEEFLVVTVRVDFGEELDRYDVAVVPSP